MCRSSYLGGTLSSYFAGTVVVHPLPVTKSTWHNGLIQKKSRVVLSESHLF